MTKRASPGIGHNGALPDHADVRTALAIEMIFEEKEKKLREEKKRARKKIEGMGIRLNDLGDLKDMRDMTGSELVELFKRRWHLAGAIHQDKFEQLDMFAPKASAPEVRAAHYTLGLLAGLQGKDLEIPPLVVGDDRQQMIDGHNEGRDRRKKAEEALLVEALDGGGRPVDGTPAAVSARAAADFAKDTGDDPLVVSGVKYQNMRQANAARKRLASQGAAAPATGAGDAPVPDQPLWADFPTSNADWTDEQRDTFCTWFDALPEDTAVPIGVEYPGAVAEFRRLRDARAETQADAAPAPARRPPMRPDFHGWDDDWQKWTGTQTMEFRRWFEGLPAGDVPPITHEGASAYFALLREEAENRASGSEDDDGAPGRQEAELPDPAETAAAAKKLQENGFVPNKRRRAPA